MPARASEAPINFRNPRRETASSHSDAPLGNSRCIISWNSGLPASSSRLRQYSGPLVSAMRSRAASKSSLPFLLGQTSSRRGLLFSSVFIRQPNPLKGGAGLQACIFATVLEGALAPAVRTSAAEAAPQKILNAALKRCSTHCSPKTFALNKNRSTKNQIPAERARRPSSTYATTGDKSNNS